MDTQRSIGIQESLHHGIERPNKQIGEKELRETRDHAVNRKKLQKATMIFFE